MIHRTRHGSRQYLALVDGAGVYVNVRLAEAVIPSSGGERLPESVLRVGFGC